ncbi:MAG: luciferase family protein [Chloroflexota bacterium]
MIIVLISVGTLLGACANTPEQVQEQTEVMQVEEQATATQVVEAEEPVIVETSTEPAATPTVEPPDATVSPLPERAGPRTQTTGTVPHVQIDVEPVTAVNDELFRLAYALPGVENRPTIVSLPGARGMWLSEDIAVAKPKAIVNGREFAHIHPDGSLHAPLSLQRSLEVEATGWGERHPWADQRDGWEGFVMLYTPQSMDELDITFQLIVESYNYVTGQTIQASDFQ